MQLFYNNGASVIDLHWRGLCSYDMSTGFKPLEFIVFLLINMLNSITIYDVSELLLFTGEIHTCQRFYLPKLRE